jgi:hypothetical protein
MWKNLISNLNNTWVFLCQYTLVFFFWNITLKDKEVTNNLSNFKILVLNITKNQNSDMI